MASCPCMAITWRLRTLCMFFCAAVSVSVSAEHAQSPGMPSLHMQGPHTCADANCKGEAPRDGQRTQGNTRSVDDREDEADELLDRAQLEKQDLGEYTVLMEEREKAAIRAPGGRIERRRRRWQQRTKLLRKFRERRAPPRVSYVVVDNVYTNPHEVRAFALKQDFSVKGNYPGRRTKSFADDSMKELIQTYVYGAAGRLTYFPNAQDDENTYNGAWQISTSRDRTWIHSDGWNSWAGVLFMTPGAPASAGTGLFRHRGTGITTFREAELMGIGDELDNSSQDYTQWEKVDQIGNVFNRLVLFDASQYHCSLDYFGYNDTNGRLFQTFFFNTEGGWHRKPGEDDAWKD